MNDFNSLNISSLVQYGNERYRSKCPICNSYNDINNIKRFFTSKIQIIKCSNCNQKYQVGDIYNFETGTKLNNRIGNSYTQNNVDKLNWNPTNTRI